jgi:alkylation response protein AidB-like acyl-CoA dehydrogenase
MTETLHDAAAAWIKDNWTGTDSLDWRNTVVDSGYAVPSWSTDNFGLGVTRDEAREVLDAFTEAGVPGGARDVAPFTESDWMLLPGAPLTDYGTPEQKERLLRPLITDEWGVGCLLYSEPGSGSDLASIQTKAELDESGENYIINGQKVWTTHGHLAKFAILIARTDWDVPKHAGISLFIFPMKQEGVEVVPIRQMTGGSEFNEVFLTNAKVPAANLIGGAGNGWKVLQSALGAERRGMGEMSVIGETPEEGGAQSPLFTRSDDLVDAAREAGRLDDPLIVDEMMKLHTWRLTNDWTQARAKMIAAGGGNSPLASLGKLANSRILHGAADLRYRLLGDRALQYDEAADETAHTTLHDLMMGFFNSIGGGTDQIQRNIISERVLGLPRGPQPDKNIPFKDARKAKTTSLSGDKTGDKK